MKIIFLDIDGVLNSGKYISRIGIDFDDPKNQIDSEAVQRLNVIIEKTKGAIVISSTWRLSFKNDLPKLQNCMLSYGILGNVIGATPEKNSTRNRRGKEIQAWLDENRHLNIDNYVIVDDDRDMGKLIHRAVFTKFEDGLLDHHVELIVGILNKN